MCANACHISKTPHPFSRAPPSSSRAPRRSPAPRATAAPIRTTARRRTHQLGGTAADPGQHRRSARVSPFCGATAAWARCHRGWWHKVEVWKLERSIDASLQGRSRCADEFKSILSHMERRSSSHMVTKCPQQLRWVGPSAVSANPKNTKGCRSGIGATRERWELDWSNHLENRSITI